jgi:hypothetical protein
VNEGIKDKMVESRINRYEAGSPKKKKHSKGCLKEGSDGREKKKTYFR